MTAFTMYLPPDWIRFDLGPDSAIDASLSNLVRQAPPVRQPTLRKFVETRVRPQFDALAGSGAVCVLLSLESDPTFPVVVCQPAAIPAQLDPIQWLAALANADESAELVEVPNMVAVRSHESRDSTRAFVSAYTDYVGEPVESSGALQETGTFTGFQINSERVTYSLGDPQDRSKWLSVTLNVQQMPDSAGREAVRQTIALFDAMMTSLRWVA